jgi:ABC-type multidrug transport system fused ATPase/permease subunit
MSVLGLIGLAITGVYYFSYVNHVTREEYELMKSDLKRRQKISKRVHEGGAQEWEEEDSSGLSVMTSVRSSRVEEEEGRQTNIEIPTLRDQSVSSGQTSTHNPLQTNLLTAPSKAPPPPPPMRSSFLSVRSNYSLTRHPRFVSLHDILRPEFNRPSFTSSSAHPHPPLDRESIFPQTSTSPPDEQLSTPAHHLPFEKQVTLQFQSLSYTISPMLSGGGKGGAGGAVKLLKNINGVVRPGELCAIMGATGSGKTTLLNVLAGRATIGQIEGSITANKKPFRGIEIENNQRDPKAPCYG